MRTVPRLIVLSVLSIAVAPHHHHQPNTGP
jgi:hypothetical protein